MLLSVTILLPILLYKFCSYNIDFEDGQTSVLFIIGLENEGNTEIANKITDENNTYGDLIQIDGLFEHYYDLALKTLHTMKFFFQKGENENVHSVK